MLAALLGLPRITKKIPAVLVGVVGATVVSAIIGLDAVGVKTVGLLPQGVPTPSVPWTSWSDVGPLLVGAIGITMVSITDTIATATAFAARRGDEVDPDKEMIGVGAANIGAGLFHGFAVSVSSSRTAVADQTGARSQVTGVVGAGLVLLLITLFSGLLADLPQSALAAVVIMAALSLFDLRALIRYAKVRRSSLIICLVASTGVIFWGVLQGILLAIVLAVLLFFRRSWSPNGVTLGQVPEQSGWHSTKDFPDATERDNVVIYRWEAPLFFANTGMFRSAIRKLVRDREPRWIVLHCEAMTDIDPTAAEMLKDLDLELNGQGINIAFVDMLQRLRVELDRYGLDETLDADHFYPSVHQALDAIDRNET